MDRKVSNSKYKIDTLDKNIEKVDKKKNKVDKKKIKQLKILIKDIYKKIDTKEKFKSLHCYVYHHQNKINS